MYVLYQKGVESVSLGRKRCYPLVSMIFVRAAICHVTDKIAR
jgi:hypothetical protein